MDPTQDPNLAEEDSLTNLPEVMAIKAQAASAIHQTPETVIEAGVEPNKTQEANNLVDKVNDEIQTNSTKNTNDLATKVPGSSYHPDSPAVADDNDLIEQEWVHKAKAIVERTHDDPYLQNKEINQFKADYIGKRYKREIKVDES